MSDQTQLLSPEALYEKLSTPRLLTGFYLQNRLFEMQVYLMLLHRSSLPLPTSFQQWQHQSRELRIEDIEPLYRRCRDDALVSLMVFLKIDWYMLLRELYKRFKTKPTGLDVLMENWQKVQSTWIQKRRLKIDPQEAKQSGMLKGLELLNDIGTTSLEEEEHRHFLKLPPPVFPAAFNGLLIEFAELEHKAWEALIADMWTPSLVASFKNVVPLVRGDVETTGASVDNFLREQGRKFQRQKNLLEGKERFPKKQGAESWRADWDFSRTAADGRRQEIEEKFHSRDRANRRPDVTAMMVEILRKAKKKWGSKAVKALKALHDGKTEEEAAALAGLTSRTVRNYKIKLSKEFSQKK